MGKPNYYSALGVGTDSTPAQISRAYRMLMRAHHPDVGHSPDDQSELLRIMEAFAVLRDPVRRKEYDSGLPLRRVGERSEGSGRASGRGEGDAQHTGAVKSEGGRNIPVRHTSARQQEQNDFPQVRITPVRWESGPWA